MARRIFLMLLAFLVAWNFGDKIIAATIGAIPIGAGVASFLLPDFSGKSFLDFLGVAIAAVILWLALKFLLSFLSFALPTAHRFGNTRAVRQVQWIFATAILWFVTLKWFEMWVGVFTEFWMNLSDQLPDGPINPWRAFNEYTWEWVQVVTFFASIVIYFHARYDFQKGLGEEYAKFARFLEAGRFGFGGSARFATLLEEWPLRWRGVDDSAVQKDGTVMYVGRSLYSPIMHMKIKDDRHMLTIAGSRSGKGSTVIINNLLTWRGSSIVVDPKGTNALVTAARRKELGNNVYIVDPFNIVTGKLGLEKSDGFNPLANLDLSSPTIREQLGSIAEALVVPEKGDGRSKHWDDGARTVVRGLVTHIATSDSNPNLLKIRDLLSLPTVAPAKKEPSAEQGHSYRDQASLLSAMMKNTAGGGAARDAAARILRGIETEEITNLLSNADKHTEWLSSPAMQDVLTRSTFSFAELKKPTAQKDNEANLPATGTTIYLVLPFMALTEYSRFLRLFINLAILEMAKGRSDIPVLMMLDEFLSLGHMREVEKAFVFMAGYNLFMWPFVQDLGQLRDLYGNSANSFITNSRAVQVFGVSDPVSTEFVSEKIGRRALQYAWGMGDTTRSELYRQPGEVEKEIAVPSDRSKPGLQYILRSGEAPLLLEKVRYYDKPHPGTMYNMWNKLRYPFDGLYKPDPDF